MLDSKKVVGIHTKAHKKEKFNAGYIITPICISLNNNLDYETKIYDNNEYYKGEFKNGLKEGYGTLRYMNRNEYYVWQ